MNRTPLAVRGLSISVPRASGDEPQRVLFARCKLQCSPARAGMNRTAMTNPSVILCVPRASGDEPIFRQRFRKRLRCSPRERG